MPESEVAQELARNFPKGNIPLTVAAKPFQEPVLLCAAQKR
jgi:hypothetical protein